MRTNQPLRARKLALEVYTRVIHGEYVQPTVLKVLAANPDLTAAERGVVYDLCFGTARHDFLLAQRVNARLDTPGRLPLQLILALRIAAYELVIKQGAAYGVINAWVEIVKEQFPRLVSLANGVLRRIEREPFQTNPQAYTTIEEQIQGLGLPAFLVKSLNRALGSTERVNRAVIGMRSPAPTWVTVYDEAGEQATCAELPVTRRLPQTGYPASLAVQLRSHLEHTEVFTAGHVQPQNPSSLELIRLAALPGGRLLDIASGHGIKAAGFAKLGMSVVAVETEPGRSAAGEANTRRLHTTVTHVVADATKTLPREDGERFDRVVVDAPCSGTGTLRSNPEILFRLQRKHVLALTQLQARMLKKAASAVKPGGQLWYSVCSLTYEEGDQMMGEFLAEHEEFTTQPVHLSLPGVTGTHGVYVLPEDGRDGFYFACLARQEEG